MVSVHCELIEVCTRVNVSVLYITEDFLNLDHERTRNLKRFLSQSLGTGCVFLPLLKMD